MKFKEKVVLSAVQSIEYAYSLANALSVLHAKKIAHRDIKCANIMVSIIFFEDNMEIMIIIIAGP